MESSPTVAAGSRAELPSLSATQRSVLVALCRPYKDTELATPATNQQIADELYLSVDAVKAHLRTLFGYFGVEHLPQNQKRSYLAMRALQDGVVARRDL
jgi:DNA-binding NarL/FixJ family response regulator